MADRGWTFRSGGVDAVRTTYAAIWYPFADLDQLRVQDTVVVAGPVFQAMRDAEARLRTEREQIRREGVPLAPVVLEMRKNEIRRIHMATQRKANEGRSSSATKATKRAPRPKAQTAAAKALMPLGWTVEELCKPEAKPTQRRPGRAAKPAPIAPARAVLEDTEKIASAAKPQLAKTVGKPAADAVMEMVPDVAVPLRSRFPRNPAIVAVMQDEEGDLQLMARHVPKRTATKTESDNLVKELEKANPTLKLMAWMTFDPILDRDATVAKAEASAMREAQPTPTVAKCIEIFANQRALSAHEASTLLRRLGFDADSVAKFDALMKDGLDGALILIGEKASPSSIAGLDLVRAESSEELVRAVSERSSQPDIRGKVLATVVVKAKPAPRKAAPKKAAPKPAPKPAPEPTPDELKVLRALAGGVEQMEEWMGRPLKLDEITDAGGQWTPTASVAIDSVGPLKIVEVATGLAKKDLIQLVGVGADGSTADSEMKMTEEGAKALHRSLQADRAAKKPAPKAAPAKPAEVTRTAEEEAERRRAKTYLRQVALQEQGMSAEEAERQLKEWGQWDADEPVQPVTLEASRLEDHEVPEAVDDFLEQMKKAMQEAAKAAIEQAHK